VVLRREVASQPPHGGERHLARGEEVEEHGKPPARTCRLDAITRGILGEPKGLRAIAVERPVALGRVGGWASLEFGQMSHELDRDLALPASERAQAGEEILIRQYGRGGEDVDHHAPSVP
jgi:hypothetical protein